MTAKMLIGTVAILGIGSAKTSAQIYDTNGDYVETLAGSGFSGYVDGVEQQTMFNNPEKVVADTSGNLFVLDAGNYRIRKIAPDATVTTFAGPLIYYFEAMAIDHSNAFANPRQRWRKNLLATNRPRRTGLANHPHEFDRGELRWRNLRGFTKQRLLRGHLPQPSLPVSIQRTADRVRWFGKQRICERQRPFHFFHTTASIGNRPGRQHLCLGFRQQRY
jgi:hypothetical protein